MTQPKCRQGRDEYCIRTECVGPCTTIEEIPVSDEELQRIVASVTPPKVLH